MKYKLATTALLLDEFVRVYLVFIVHLLTEDPSPRVGIEGQGPLGDVNALRGT